MKIRTGHNSDIFITILLVTVSVFTAFFVFFLNVQKADADNWLYCPPPGGNFYCACGGYNLNCTQTEAPGACDLAPSHLDHQHLNHELCMIGSITITKSVSEGSTTQNFSFSTSTINHPTISQNYNFTLTHGQSNTINNIVSGNYIISEIIPTSWQVTNISCTSDIDTSQITTDSDNGTFSLFLRKLEDVSCTFTNEGCALNAYNSCFSGDVYSFDSCDNPISVVQDCGADETTTNTICQGDDLVLESTTTTKGCSASTCTESESTTTAVLETCTYGCSSGACNAPPPPPPPPPPSGTCERCSLNYPGCWSTWTDFDGDGCSAPTPGNTAEFGSISYSPAGCQTGNSYDNRCVVQQCERCSLNYPGCWSTWDDIDGDGCSAPTVGFQAEFDSIQYSPTGCQTGADADSRCATTSPPPPPPAPTSYDLPCAFGDCSSIGAIWDNLCRRILLFATPIFVIMILVAAYDFMVGGAQAHRINRAKKTLQYGGIGYLVLLLSCFLPAIIQGLL